MVDEDTGEQEYDHSVLFEDLNEIFPFVDYASARDLEKYQPGPELIEFVQSIAVKAFHDKVASQGENIAELERYVMLKAVNDRWQEHLQTIEYIREGIGLRGYGQVDPLVAYKRETYDTFQNTLRNIRDDAARRAASFGAADASAQDEDVDHLPSSRKA